ncbi:MAG: hypothetical protein ACYCO9_11185 [Streptosporangiaceae bacterium]
MGLLLGVHGWSGRGHSLAGGAIGAQVSAGASAATTPATGPSAAPSTAAPSTAAPTQGAKATPAPTPGPKLSSQSYSSFSFEVWPGTPSATARLAETGLSISVKKQGVGISVAAGVAGQPASAPRYYPTGVKVYVIEASLGDDSGSDFNLGDDGLIVTDAQGRILQ